MRIGRVLVRNFRGVQYALMSDLRDLVVLAGQNGSGKSCILDAIRLVKSVYGGYQQNEFHQWFGEFQINFTNDPRAFSSLFNDRSKPLVIEVDFELRPSERTWLKENSQLLVTNQAWRALVPELYAWRSLNAAPFTAQFRSREAEVLSRAQQDHDLFLSEIDRASITASVSINPNEQPRFNISKILELVFSTYDLEHLGIIDYHGPHRMYGREVLSNINVNIDALEEQKKQSALYNYSAKYANVKSEMASVYVREAIAHKAGKQLGTNASITDTLKEMFATFFPDKEFLGPEATDSGTLRFPVRVGNKETHDLDELSSGEKEILYGYLRLRSSAPQNSVILLDEPELHLNPRLTRNLPQFYHRHLAKALHNQVWLVTHSDAILRGSVEDSAFSVFHMTPSAYAQASISQTRQIIADEDLDRAVLELVGDLASYNPGGRIIIFEGENSDFDLRMASDLYPELAEKANLISGTNKERVRGLHSLMQKLSDEGKLPKYRIFSITDKDSDPELQHENVNRYTWDVYHIENYLLSPKYISAVLDELSGGKAALSERDAELALRACAQETVSSLIIHSITQVINKQLVEALNMRINPFSDAIAKDLSEALENSIIRVDSLITRSLSSKSVEAMVNIKRDEILSDLGTDKWKLAFRGRDILKRFVGQHGQGLKYELFRNLIIARMRDDEFCPVGMKNVLRAILKPTPLSAT